MQFPTRLAGFVNGGLYDSVIPDFLLAFAFFTSLTYAVLSRRFGHQRPAVMMAVSLGLSLSIGLVWWESAHGWSVRDLGPVAVGFALIVLAGVMYQAIRRVGGNWAGAGIAFGASLLIGWTLGFDLPVDGDLVQGVAIVAVVVAVAAIVMRRTRPSARIRAVPVELPRVRHDMRDLERDHRVARRIGKGLRHLRRETQWLGGRPDVAEDVRLHAMLVKVDAVPPNRTPKTTPYDTHPWIPAKRLSDMPEVQDALRDLINNWKPSRLLQLEKGGRRVQGTPGVCCQRLHARRSRPGPVPRRSRLIIPASHVAGRADRF